MESFVEEVKRLKGVDVTDRFSDSIFSPAIKLGLTRYTIKKLPYLKKKEIIPRKLILTKHI